MCASGFPDPPVALCLGGMDPSGGAGLLRDAMALAALGVQPMAIPVAETLQNGLACLRIEPPALDPLARLEALEPHLSGAWGVKLGMCALDEASFHGLARALDSLAPTVRIWDPLLAPSRGAALHDAARLRRMADGLLSGPHWIVAPNRPEAAALADLPPDAPPEALARPWLERGARAVWLKGGHGVGNEVEDFWITPQGARSLGAQPRLPGERRGTGCTLAATWLGLRLLGWEDVPAAREAAQRLRAGWDHAFAPGGIGRPLFKAGAP